MIIELDNWLLKNGLSRCEFARRFRISQPFVNQIINQKRKVSPKMADYIERITGGEVKKKHLRPDMYCEE